jgi:hypothetical protein
VFLTVDDLTTHQQRRHGILKTVAFKEEPQVVEYDPSDPLMKHLLRHVETSDDLRAPVPEITEAYLLEFTGEACLEDITQLMLREFGLDRFESSKSLELERFESLESLSLSHNRLTDLSGVSLCASLQDLNINNNAVRDIHPLSQLLELRRLWASNNLIEILIPLENCKLLTELALFGNKLADLDLALTSLAELPKLETLELERNPCTMRTSNSRYMVVNRLRLKMLDGEAVTDLDYYIAKDFAEERPPPRNFVGKLRSSVQFQKMSELELLEQEIEELRTSLAEVTEERDALRKEFLAGSRDNHEGLLEENKRLQREVANMYVLLDENIELRRQIDEGSSERARSIFAENMRLKARISELEDSAPKKSLQRPQTAGARLKAPILDEEEEEEDELTALMTRNFETLKAMRKDFERLKES